MQGVLPHRQSLLLSIIVCIHQQQKHLMMITRPSTVQHQEFDLTLCLPETSLYDDRSQQWSCGPWVCPVKPLT